MRIMVTVSLPVGLGPYLVCKQQANHRCPCSELSASDCYACVPV